MWFGGTLADGFALALFVVAFLGYSAFADRAPLGRSMTNGGRSLNAHMREIRRIWVRRLLDRDDRVGDAILSGHSANSISFFASATALVLAGLIGMLSQTSTIYAMASNLTFVAATSLELFQLKLFGLMALFIYCFYRFTWALLLFSYHYGLLGSAPPAQHLVPELAETMADQIATVLNSGFTNFNAGIRTYYYAMAWTGWFIRPEVFVVATIGMTGILLLRQLGSPSAKAIRNYALLLEENNRQEPVIRPGPDQVDVRDSAGTRMPEM